MKAVVCTELGGPEQLGISEVATPVPGAGEVRVKVGAAGVNFPDTLIIQGRYQARPKLPFIPGFEFAGEIIEVGREVCDRRVGDRIVALTACGYAAFAEQAIARAGDTVLLPHDVSDIVAAAMYTSYGTAYHALIQRGDLRAGQTVVVLGATGGVGLAAVEIAALMGARVIAVGRSGEKLMLARKKGATETIVYPGSELRTIIRDLTKGAGADVCIDMLGGSGFDEMSRAMAWNGRLLTVGYTSGVVPRLAANLPLLNGYQLVGVYWGAFASRAPEDNAANFQVLTGWMAESKIDPDASIVWPMERAAEALQAILNRTTVGKIVLTSFSKSL